VRVLIYGDLQSSDCARFRVLLDQKILPGTDPESRLSIAIFRSGSTDWARPAAIAARWVSEQSNELGITVRRELLSEQDSINSQNLKQWFIDFAYRNHLDPKGIVDALTDQRLAALVDQDRQSAVARGVSRAPRCMWAEWLCRNDHLRRSRPRLDEALAK